MVFSSIEFLWLFMPLVLAAYLVVPPRLRNATLAAASLVFYVWGAHAVLFLFLASITFNYVVGRFAADRRVLVFGVVVNLLGLAFWKYAVFVADQLDALLGLAGGGVGTPHIALPIGISFFTFHGISYLVDIHRGQAQPLRSIVDYAQYMAFFPQLIAGPIIRYHQIDDQIRTPPPRAQRLDDIAQGFPRFALGLSKKVLVADKVAPIADAAFANGADVTTPTAWLGALAYTIQIYFDFSGYSDMAIGLARMFGFRFPENFARPYSAVSLTDFWRRWHMTLSRWFRDYVYIPLGGSRGASETTIRNLLVVFFLTGIWHGAGWTFILWGLYHGLLLVGERVTGIRTLPDARMTALRRAATFLLVLLGWVLFRSADVGQAGDFYRAMAGLDAGALSDAVRTAASPEAVAALVVGVLSVLLPRDFVTGVRVGESRSPVVRIAVVALAPLAAIAVAAGSFSPFLYFQF